MRLFDLVFMCLILTVIDFIFEKYYENKYSKKCNYNCEECKCWSCRAKKCMYERSKK